MHPLDIFSDSPKYFIFQKETNKTNFGGVLTLFFILIMIFISLLYLLDYIDMNNYSIEYSHIITSTLKDNIPIMNSIPENNPNLTFHIELLDSNDNPLSENFILYDSYTMEMLDRKENYTIIDRRISDFSIVIFYNCINESSCSLREKDKSYNGYNLRISYTTQKIDLQNEPTPITEDSITNVIQTSFYYNYLYSKYFDWEVIKYKEQNTLFNRFSDKKNEYVFGHFSNSRETIIEDDDEEGYVKLLMMVSFSNMHLSYVEYKRKRKTILDLVAKITSLFQTLRFAFLFVFKYYSKNFNNYKIIEKVLDINNKNFRERELNSALYEPADNIINPINNKNNNLTNPLISNSKKNTNLIINDNDIDNNEIDDLLKTKILPKLSFMHFFCNNLYFNKCSKFRSQETLHICNKILLKYISIDSILYNQMKLENLFKDYKWNNPILNNIEKNELINKLKTLI